MSLAVAYGMKKRMAKGGMAHKADCPGCEMCMAKGGDVKGVHKAQEGLEEPGTSEAGFENERANFRSGMAKQFQRGAYQSMAGEHHSAAKDKHHKVLGEIKESAKHDRKNLAEGGFVEEEESSGYQPEPMENPEHMVGHDVENQDHDMEALDMVSHIMKMRDMAKGYSEGGAVSNDAGEGQEADKLPNQFDDLVLDSDQMDGAEYTGENSGDEIGNEQKDEDERDVVSSIMKSRKKKDRLPNPR